MTPRDPSPAAAAKPRRIAGLVLYWLPVLAYMGLIFSLSSIKGKDIPSLFPNMDKLAHLLEYSLLGLLLGRAIRFTMVGRTRAAASIATVLLGAFIGMSDELYQRVVPGRNSDVRDWVTDVLAISLSVAFTQWVSARSLRRGAAASKGDSPK